MNNNFWQKHNVLVTGGNGFIGGALSRELVERGANVVIIVRDWSRIERKVTIVKGSIVDLGLIHRILTEYKVETVFHLAAQAIVGTANVSPLATFESNIMGTWNILEACRRSPQVKRIVVASSDKAYGDQEQLPYVEEMPLFGISPYDASKACADILARSFHHTYGLPLAVTRCSNVYGGGDLNFSRIVPSAILSAIKGEQPVIRSDGTSIRDFLYIDDAVRAYLILAEALSRKEVQGRAYNFGSTNPITIIDLVSLILSLVERNDLKPKVLLKHKISGEIDKQFVSIARAKRELNWEPKWKLEDGLKQTIDWYREYLIQINK